MEIVPVIFAAPVVPEVAIAESSRAGELTDAARLPASPDVLRVTVILALTSGGDAATPVEPPAWARLERLAGSLREAIAPMAPDESLPRPSMAMSSDTSSRRLLPRATLNVTFAVP